MPLVGPFASRGEAEAVCGSSSSSSGVYVPCCARVMPDVLYLTISGKGTWPMPLAEAGADQTCWATGPIDVPDCGTVDLALCCVHADGSWEIGNEPGADCVLAFDIFPTVECGPPLVYTRGATFPNFPPCVCADTVAITITE